MRRRANRKYIITAFVVVALALLLIIIIKVNGKDPKENQQAYDGVYLETTTNDVPNQLGISSVTSTTTATAYTDNKFIAESTETLNSSANADYQSSTSLDLASTEGTDSMEGSPDGRRGAELDTPFEKDGIVIVNKNHWVSANYRPVPDEYENVRLADPAWEAFLEMQEAAKEDGVYLQAVSTYRTYERQEALFNMYSARSGEEAANRYSSRPGQSEHQTGLAVDVTAGEDLTIDFADTKAGRWLWTYAYRYGFILRYPEGKEEITGYQFEPWHYRYIGKEHASNFGPNSTLTLEEYLDID